MKELYRGDLYDKGEELKAELKDYTLNGEPKNLANFFFFTDDYEKAVLYATEVLNDSMRGGDVKTPAPTLTTVEVNTDNLLDISKYGSDCTVREAYQILCELTGKELTLLECAKFGLVGSYKTLTDPTNRFQSITMQESENLYAKMTGKKKYKSDEIESRWGFVKLTNYECGVFFKEWLLENGYNGFIFHDRFIGHYEAKDYAFINSEDIRITKKERV